MKEAARQRDLAASFDGAAIFKGNVRLDLTAANPLTFFTGKDIGC
ncbi:hypothetical protein ACQKL0_00075 [Peribacillus sp. NPDC097264]